MRRLILARQVSAMACRFGNASARENTVPALFSRAVSGPVPGHEVTEMTSYFIQGSAPVVPAVDPEYAHWLVPEALRPYGLGSIGRVADRGDSLMQISQTVDAPSARAAVDSLQEQLRVAEERRQREARVIRFSMGRFEAHWVSEWSPDGELGPARIWSVPAPQ